VPMCQSPKIANVPVHAKGLPANDNCPPRSSQCEVPSGKRPPLRRFGRLYLASSAFSVLLLFRKVVALGVRRIL